MKHNTTMRIIRMKAQLMGTAVITAGGDVRCVGVRKIGIYIKDSYDFNGRQILGWWKSTANYGGKKPSKGDLVTNGDFRAHGGGFDFRVFADMKVEAMSPIEFFYAP